MLLANAFYRIANIFYSALARSNVSFRASLCASFRHMTAEVTIRWIIVARAYARGPRAPCRRAGSVPEIPPCPAPTGTSQARSGPTRAG